MNSPLETAWVRYMGKIRIFYPRVKSLMSESGVQEISFQPCLIVLFNILLCIVLFYVCSVVHLRIVYLFSFLNEVSRIFI